MRKNHVVVTLVLGLLGAAGVLLAPSLVNEDEVPVMRWDESEEVVVTTPTNDDVDAATGSLDERQQVELATGAVDDERTERVMRGRVVDRFHGPVAGAKVWLDFARGGPRDRGGRQRRVPEPVVTDAEGRFAFQGQTFRNLRVSLLVAHERHAPGVFDRNLGDAAAEHDFGELMLTDGGALSGRVTDLDGNGVPDAEVRLQPENENRMRMQRATEVAQLVRRTDTMGYYAFANVTAGDWRVAASAPRHTEGRSEVKSVEEGLRVEVEDIRLGPGFDIAGLVSDVAGQPVPGADVVARPRRDLANAADGGQRGRGNRGNFDFGGGEQRGRTDERGRFHLDHLPSAPLDLTVHKDGYLRTTLREIDPKTGQQIFVTLPDGLKITGTVTDAKSGDPVGRYAIAARWVRPLPQPGAENVDPARLFEQWSNGSLDEGARRQLREGAELVRAQLTEERAAWRTRGPGGSGGPGGPPTAGWSGTFGGRGGIGRPEAHPGGRFTATGLQEGVYVVEIESPEHAVHRSDEVELRTGAPAPDLAIALVRGFAVRGTVRDADGQPIAGARVQLRTAEPATNDGAATNDAPAPAAGPGRQRGRGGRQGGRGGDMMREFAAAFAPVVGHATSDARGSYVIEHAPAGTFRVNASAEAFEDAHSEPFELAADVTGVDLALGALGSLRGRVLGARPEQLDDVRVVAFVPGNPMQGMRRGGSPFADVAPDGTYRFAHLAPGSYAVRAFVGDGMRSLMEQVMSGAEIAADVVVKAKEVASFDVTVTLPEVGEVAGSVLHNGHPAAGFQVTLRRENEDGGGQGPGRNGAGPRGGMRFGGQRQYNAAVGASGRFAIGNLPAGNYQLTVAANGRRSGVLHRETVVVQTGLTSEVTISLATATIEGVVQADDGTPAADLDGNVMLAPGLTQLPDNLGELRRSGTTFNARIENGAFAFEMLPQGNYLAVVTVRGRERAAVPVFAAVGQKTTLTLKAGARSGDGETSPGQGPAPTARPRNEPSGRPDRPGAPGNRNRGNRGR